VESTASFAWKPKVSFQANAVKTPVGCSRRNMHCKWLKPAEDAEDF